MAEAIPSPVTGRCAIVTGANKGIGFETCRQLAATGVMVVLTARNEKRGGEALQRLRASGVSDDLVIFHQLDVADPASVASLVDFINTRFGKLDILINNAGIGGVTIEGDVLVLEQLIEDHGYRLGVFDDRKQFVTNGRIVETYELAEECLEINYYGAKRMIEAFLPLLQRSDLPRIVNVSSLMGSLQLLSNEWAIGALRDVESLTEERIDEVINGFLKDFKEGCLKAKNWPVEVSAYKLAKAAMNAYTRIVAKNYPTVCTNSLCPGYVKTDITGNTGRYSVEEGAESVVKLALLPQDITGYTGRLSVEEGAESEVKLALLPQELVVIELMLAVKKEKRRAAWVRAIRPEPFPPSIRALSSGGFLVSSWMCAIVTGPNKGIGFETCRQLAATGVMVVLTARNEKRGSEALQRLRASGVSDDLVIFHQLDVADPASVASLVDFINTRFGKLDILINNAGIGGNRVEGDVLVVEQLIEDHFYRLGVFDDRKQFVTNGRIVETYELAEECLEINYYGAKRMIEAFLPLLQRSDLPRIVNVSSLMGLLKLLSNEWAISALSDVESLTEERIDEVTNKFLKDFKEGCLKAKNWPVRVSAYKLSKAAMNAYTRIIAKNYPTVCTNSLCPGFVKTDITGNTGRLSVEEGAESVVKLALLPQGKPSGLLFSRQQIFSSF